MRSRKLCARLLGDAHDDPVGQHPRAAGDRAAVAARLADDRGRLAGDRRLVDRGDALHDVAVARDQVAGLAHHQVAGARARPRAPAPPPRPRRSRRAVSSLRVARSASAWALPRPSAMASARFAKTTVSQSQKATTPVNQQALGLPADQVGQEDPRGDGAADLDDEHHRVADLDPRVELAERGPQRRDDDVPREAAWRRGSASVISAPGRTGEPVQVEVEQEDVDAGLARGSRATRPSVLSSISRSSTPRESGRRGPRRCGSPAGARWPA